MRMIRPSPGECADRQTILNLKAKYADTGELKVTQDSDVEVKDPVEGTYAYNRRIVKGASKVDIQPWLYEAEEVQQYLERNWFPDFPQVADEYDALLDQLAEVNEKLWKLEDEARVLRRAKKDSATMYRAGTVLFEITESNDRRAELVQAINKLFGVSAVEKVYAHETA